MIAKGERMPSFTATDQNGKVWDEKMLLSKPTVIYAYPKDSTPGCTAEACSIRDSHERFLAMGYQIFGVSRDSVESHIRFAEKYSLPFPLLSDPDHLLLEALGAWGEKKLYGKVTVGTIRSTFIFDADGICTDVISKVDTRRAAEQLLKGI